MQAQLEEIKIIKNQVITNESDNPEEHKTFSVEKPQLTLAKVKK